MLDLQRRFTQSFVRIHEQFVAGEPMSMFQLDERRRKKTTIALGRGARVAHGRLANYSESHSSVLL